MFGFNRRKAARYRVQDLELSLLGENARENVRVDDLSVEGISFTYIDSGEPLDTVIDLDLQAGREFKLGRVKAKLVADTLVADDLTKMTTIRRFSGRFINLSATQHFDLREFLKHHGID
jgi:hypothetical protein